MNLKFQFLLSFILILSHLSFGQESFWEFKPKSIKEDTVQGKDIVVKFIDSRIDTNNSGFIQTGIFNKKTFVKLAKSFPMDIDTIFRKFMPQNHCESYVFQIRKLIFSEITSAREEKGYFTFRATIYEKCKQKYFFLTFIDTLISVKSSDVTKQLKSSATNILIKFIKKYF